MCGAHRFFSLFGYAVSHFAEEDSRSIWLLLLSKIVVVMMMVALKVAVVVVMAVVALGYLHLSAEPVAGAAVGCRRERTRRQRRHSLQRLFSVSVFRVSGGSGGDAGGDDGGQRLLRLLMMMMNNKNYEKGEELAKENRE